MSVEPNHRNTNRGMQAGGIVSEVTVLSRGTVIRRSSRRTKRNSDLNPNAKAFVTMRQDEDDQIFITVGNRTIFSFHVPPGFINTINSEMILREMIRRGFLKLEQVVAIVSNKVNRNTWRVTTITFIDNDIEYNRNADDIFPPNPVMKPFLTLNPSSSIKTLTSISGITCTVDERRIWL